MLRPLLLGLFLCLSASQAGADALSRASMAGLSGSERLRMFALAEALDTGRAPPAVTSAMRGAMERAGYYHAGSPAVIGHSLRATPVLTWDDNINGGYVNDRLDLFGLSFAVAPANLARAGWLLGGRVDGSLRLAWGEGRLLDLSASFEAAWSPEHEMGRADATLGACLRNPLGGWNFLDLCASNQAAHRALSDSRTQQLGLRFSHLTGSARGAHELSAELSQRWLADGRQEVLTLGWNAVWDRAVTELRLGLATPVAGAQATRLQLSARVGWRWDARPVSLSLWHSRSTGGMLMGMVREDRQLGIGLSLQPRPGVSLDLTHQVTRSTIGLFDEARTGLGLRFQLGRS